MVYFISDVHLGTRIKLDFKEHLNRFITLLKRMENDASQIFLLGDVFEFWYEYFWFDPSKKVYDDLFTTIRMMTQKGIQIHFFIGNHDQWTFGYLKRKTGMIIHKQPYQTQIYGKKFFMAHGDGLVPSYFFDNKLNKTSSRGHFLASTCKQDCLDSAHRKHPQAISEGPAAKIYTAEELRKIRKFIRMHKMLHNPFLRLLFRLVPPSLGNYIGLRTTYRSRLHEMAHPAAYLGEDREALVLFAKEKELVEHFDFYVFGHRHILLDQPLAQGGHVIILGDFFQQWTYGRLDEKGEFELCKD